MAVWIAAGPAHAGVVEFAEQAEWQAAAGTFATIDFTGFPQGTVITTQYQHLGVTFTDGDDFLLFLSSYTNDGWGLWGSDDVTLAFETPQRSIAVEFPGNLRILLFSDGVLMYTSGFFSAGFDPLGFGGLVSTAPFDSVVFTNSGVVNFDDLHVGVPAPSGLLLIALLGGWLARRRPRDG